MVKTGLLFAITVASRLVGFKKGGKGLIENANSSVGGPLDTTHTPQPRVITGRYLGVTCGYNNSNILTGGQVPPVFSNHQNRSFYDRDPNNPNTRWDEWVSEIAQAGVEFVCANIIGSQSNTAISPANLRPLIASINARGLTSQLKIAAFDDNVSSLISQSKMVNSRGFGAAQPLEVSNSTNWKYIYDYNYKIFFQTVPDANLFKINNQPVIIVKTGHPSPGTFVTNMQGIGSKTILYIREKCMQDFGFKPFIILDFTGS